MKIRKKCLFTALVLALFSYSVSSQALAQPTTIEDTLRFAFTYSPNVKAAQELRQQSVHNLRAAEAGYYPTIGIWGGAGIENNDNTSTRIENSEGEAVGAVNFGLTLSQTIWQGGNTAANVRMRREEIIYRAWTLMDSANSLAYSAISAHADVLRRKSLVKLTEEYVAENRKILNMLRTRFQQGLSSKGDVDLVIGRLKRAEATLSIHKQALESAFAAYTKVTGQPVPAQLADVPMPKRIFNNVDEAKEISVNKNISIQTSLAAIRNAMAEKDVARSNLAPRISVDAGPSYSNKSYEGINHSTTWSAALNMSWNIYNGGKDVATMQGIAAKVRELRHRLHETMDLINQELVSTFSLTERSLEQSKLFKEASIASNRAKTNYSTQFEVGQKDLLSVLDAEGEYYFSASEHEIRKVDALLGHYRILAIAGELLELVGVKHASLLIDTSEENPAALPWSFKPTTLDTQEALKGTTLTTK